MSAMECFAIVPPGLEEVACEELTELAFRDVRIEDGGLGFRAGPDGLSRVNLRARTVTRVLVRLAEFRALSFPELFNKTSRIHWRRYIPADAAVTVRAACHRSRLMHSGRVAQVISAAIASRLGDDLAADRESASHEQLIIARFDRDRCEISIDSSGERLDRRGYRVYPGVAPIRETLAAGIIRWLGWRADEPLFVPMCGSGTFAIEAALIGLRRAPNLGHDFAMLHWPSFNTRRWRRVLEKTMAMEEAKGLRIVASDIDARVLRQARTNAEKAGVADIIHFLRQDIRRLRGECEGDAGLMICNPPYGERIKGNTIRLYRDLGLLLRGPYQDWRAAVIVPDRACEKALALPAQRRLRIKHGGRWLHVLAFAAGRGGSPQRASDPADRDALRG